MKRERKPNGYWTLKNTLKECRKLVRQEGNLPTQQRLKALGLSSVGAAIQQHGGMHKVRKLLGIESKAPERPKGYWNKDKVLEVYQEVTEELGHPPSNSDLDRLGYNGMNWVIGNKYGGHNKIRKELGLEGHRRDGYWTEKRVLTACRRLVKREGDLPSQNELLTISTEESEFRGLPTAIGKIGGLRKVRNSLNLEQRAKEDFYWTKENIRNEAKGIVDELGYLPTQKELAEMDRKDLIGAISKNYGFNRLRRDLGFEVNRADNNSWTEEKILKDCRKLVRSEGDLPSNSKLMKMGYGALASQIMRQGGYRHFRELLGLEQKQVEKGYWENEKNALKKAREIIRENELDRLPSQTQLFKMGYSSFAAAIGRYHGGFYEFRIKLGEKPIKAKNRTHMNWETFEPILTEIIDEIGHFPSYTDLKNLRRSSIGHAISKYHGGMEEVAKRMGYEVTTPIRTENQLVGFLNDNPEAQAIADLASVTEDTGEIADMLVNLWPDRFPSASQLARSLPSAVQHIGHSLHPFSMDKARGLYEKTRSLPSKTRYALDELLYSIVIDQYQKPFNEDPQGTLQELRGVVSQRNGVKRLATKVLDYYKDVYGFTIPGHGKVKEAI